MGPEEKDWRRGKKARLRLSAPRKKRFIRKRKSQKCEPDGINISSPTTLVQEQSTVPYRISNDDDNGDGSQIEIGVIGNVSGTAEPTPQYSIEVKIEDESKEVSGPTDVDDSVQCAPTLQEEAEEKTLKVEPWLVSKFLCRCCHAEGDFDSMTSAQGDEPPPEDMLLDVFNIQLFAASGPLKAVLHAICPLCRARLRDAFDFARQVRACEALFERRFDDIRAPVLLFTVEPDGLQKSPYDSNNDGEAVAGGADDSDDLLSENTQTKKKSKRTPKKKAKTKKDAENGSKLHAKLMEKRKNVRRVYKTGDGYHCIKCDETGTDYNAVVNHFRKEHATIQCEHCPERFRAKSCLLKHKLNEHNIDERITCNACNKVYFQKSTLRHHINSYHMMGKKLKCSMCDYVTYRKLNLSKHQLVHTGVKQHVCEYCKKSFVRRGTLIYHERIHTGDKRKKCAECGQTFVQKASLNYHMAKYHPEVRF